MDKQIPSMRFKKKKGQRDHVRFETQISTFFLSARSTINFLLIIIILTFLFISFYLLRNIQNSKFRNEHGRPCDSDPGTG